MSIQTINVTAEDIEMGEQGKCRWCPVARAISRHLTEEWIAEVSPHYAYFYPSLTALEQGEYESAPLTTEAHRFITDYDAERVVQPFTFPLEVPQSATED